MIIATAAMCLAINVYHEARSESVPGQYAVAQVTLKRAGGDRKKICREVFRPKQFSWTNKHVKKVKGGWKLDARLVPKDLDAWDKALRIARWQLAGRMPNLVKKADHYHTTAVKPEWRLQMRRVKRIDDHIFYVANSHP
jgi:N-acetylmuramoyl-L-alanine amidase